MNNPIPKSVIKLIEEFQKIPGVGPKSAARMAFYYLKGPSSSLKNLSNNLIEVSEKICKCSICANFTDNQSGICKICEDSNRDQNQIMVVEDPLDIISIEQTGSYGGEYHVLGGLISPVNGVGPDELSINQLLKRVEQKERVEIIFGLTPNLEGEATVSYIAKKIEKNKNVIVSTLARGLPTGADLDYADSQTIQKAYIGRNLFSTTGK